jgi:Uma2 family endonuclease
MSAVAEKTLITPEEFLRMPDQKDFELIDGELVPRYGEPGESRVSALSSWVGTNLGRLIGNHVEPARLGWVFGPDNGFQCFADRPKTVRSPDVSFVKAGRTSWDQIARGWLRIAPDLVVEVISPNEKVSELDEKIAMFLKEGVPLIWIVNPDVRTIRILRVDGSTAILREGDELSGESVLPGFTCPVASIFAPKSPAPTIAAPQ